MKHFLLTTVSALSFLSLNSSCSSDIDDQQEIYNMPSCQLEQQDENSSENGIAIPDSIMWGHHDFQNNDTKMEIAGSNDDQPMVGYGYTNKSIASYKTKIRYNSTSPVVIGAGLPGGIHFVEIIKVTKTLYSYRAHYTIDPTDPDPEKKDMGLKESGYSETDLGWYSSETHENGDKEFHGTTYLIHFLYDLSGAQLDRYYPCRPESLVWKYTSEIKH